MFSLPAILVPYPHAWRYQKTNAEYLARQNAAVIIVNAALSEKLLDTVQSLMRDPERLALMSSAMKSLAQPEAAEKIARQLYELAGIDPGGESA